MKKVDLNVDIAEGFPYDKELLQFATSANICLGFHAGNRDLTEWTYWHCVDRSIRKGAHPGYADRKTMGRGPRPTNGLDTDGDSQLMAYYDLKFDYLKPHGTLYNDSARPLTPDWDTVTESISEGSSYDPIPALLYAESIAAAEVVLLLGSYSHYVIDRTSYSHPMVRNDPPLMGLPYTNHEWIAQYCKVKFICEGFADRAYRPNGTLVPRSEPGAVLENPEEIKAQVLRLADQVDSICLHGDTPNCLEFAEMVYKTLIDHGYEVGY